MPSEIREVRSFETLATIREAYEILGRLGSRYQAALRLGLQCRRLFSETAPSQERRSALIDLPTESPAIAAAASRGCALSEDRDERLDAAMCLPVLAETHPDEAESIRELLSTDRDPG